jgi:hypothetical protein
LCPGYEVLLSTSEGEDPLLRLLHSDNPYPLTSPRGTPSFL